ncbi:MAG: AAA family ATPase [Syntrophotalea sp.]|uniref:AAA family ATPase n=1 Tax=Syntrophotalea sp. TaxID=2812029 RepID=UPI003D095B13
MRILQIRFKNLNSLAGEWEIDLAHPAFASDGIFAITGPTGAGKSTILDAVCLALYGRTPRLNKVTRAGNEIMSRQTGECFAEVTFETEAGRFRCHWSQHRARRRPDGELQAPKHEIADADSGAIFESRIRGVAEQIEAATGMDFDRFTRSMLLAQGGFAAFLQAAPDERAPILEQITGTEIYSRISIRVHERQREERVKLDTLQVETAGIALLEPEQEKQILQELEARQKQESDLVASSEEAGRAMAWLLAVEAMKQEIVSLAEEANRLQSVIDGFRPERDKLVTALRAASLDGAHATLTAIRKQQADDQKALTGEQGNLPALEDSAKRQEQSQKLAEHRTAEVKQALRASQPLIQKVRSLDQKLADQEKAVREAEENCRNAAAKSEADKQARLRERQKRFDAQHTLEGIDAYLREHAPDEWLVSGLAGVEEQLGALLSRQTEIAQRQTDQKQAAMALERARRLLDDRQKQGAARRRQLDDASNRLQQARDALNRLLGGRLLREYRTEKETLLREMAFLVKIAELEEHRSKLEDGRPCPLCGATEHPFAQGNVPAADETEQRIEALARMIRRAEDQEAAIRKCEEAEASAGKNLVEAEKQEAAAAHEEKSASKALVEVTNGLEKLCADFTERRQSIADKLQLLGFAFDFCNPESAIRNLQARAQTWQTQVRKKAEIEKRIAALDSEMQRLDAVIETHATALAEKREGLESLKTRYAAGSDERRALYGDKCPEDEELRLNKAVLAAESAEKQVRDRYNELRQQWSTAKAHVESLQMRIDRRTPELRHAEAVFSSALAAAGFLDEEQFLAARLSAGQRDALSAKARLLDDRQIELQARQKDRETRLAAEMARKLTDKSVDQLERQCTEYQNALKELRGTVAGLSHRLSENRAARERIKARQAAIEAQQAECRRWDNLHQLIGSADGRKYRNFAQGLTFEMMIGHANRQLQKMSDRYLLVRDEGRPLELNVIDNYQAGEVRSTKNLSGGESFLVSLALALGLSQMASRNVRVDSLFLDEGFGTLDEEALDTALETLTGLQQDGKLIGLISHVAALKERISARIEVIPRAGGRSRVAGPGCREVRYSG